MNASYDAFNRRDWEALVELYTEDCVWDISRVSFGAAGGFEPVYHGHEGLRRMFDNWEVLLEGWSRPGGSLECRFDRAWVLEGGDFLVDAWYGVEDADGNETQIVRFAQTGSARAGKIAKVVFYPSLDAAREDAEAVV